MSRPRKKRPVPTPDARRAGSLDDQLSSVMEQDALYAETTSDDVADFDRTTVELVIRRDGGRERPVAVRKGEHAPSPYVLSLQNVLLSTRVPRTDERVRAREASKDGASGLFGVMPPEVYATVSRDLSSDVLHPHIASGQFTPQTFNEAYAAVYGRFDRLTSGARDALSVLGSWVRRAESAEHEAVEHLDHTMSVLEVPRVSLARALAGFAVMALIVTLPANAVALYRAVSKQQSAAARASNEAAVDLVRAKNAGSIPGSAEALKRASNRFREADAVLSESNALAIGLASVLPATYRSARALLEIGDKASDAGRLLALGLDKVFADPGRRLDERLDVLGAYARTALVLLSDASKAAATVDPSKLPKGSQEKVAALLRDLDRSTQSVREFAAFSDLLSDMAGKDHRRTYLVIFQNDTELRPTGGFMGSFAEVTLDRGRVTSVRTPPGGTYALKGQLLANVVSPKPLQLVNPRWQFQDANWSPDFPTAARKIRWFWSKAGQPTIDGVIAVNASFVEKLLAFTGPIEMPEYGKTIDASNFLLETQKAVELEYDKAANTPKKFIGDLGAKLITRMSSIKKDDWLSIASLVSGALETKDIQVALMDTDEEQIAERYGWSGRIKDTSGDALAIVEANIAGQKTDGVIDESVDHAAAIHEDGSIEDTVRLNRTHLGKKGELFRGVRNVSYVRFYVPKGSTLLSASGFIAPPAKLFKPVDEDDATDPDIEKAESGATAAPGGVGISEEGSRTVFAGWLQLDPGMSQTIALTYRLPFTVSDVLSKAEAAPQNAADAPRGAYTMLLTSQSGKSGRRLSSTVTLPERWKLSWSRTSGGGASADLGYTGAWDRDLVLAALLAPPSNGQDQR